MSMAQWEMHMANLKLRSFRGLPAQPDYGGAPTRPNREGVFVHNYIIPGSIVMVLANLRLEMSQIIGLSAR